MVKNYRSCSCCNAFSNLQLQSRLPGASHQIDQRSRSARSPLLFAIFVWNRALATGWYTFCRPHLPKVFRTHQFFNVLQIELSLFADLIFQKCSEAVSFLRFSSANEARNPGNRDPTAATPGATLPEKMQGFAPERVFTQNSQASELLHFPTTWWWVVDMMMRLAWWWCGWHDGGKANHDSRPQLGSREQIYQDTLPSQIRVLS